MDLSKNTGEVAGIRYSPDHLIIRTNRGEVQVFPTPINTFERISNLWSAAMGAVLAAGGDWTFIQCWQNSSLYRKNFLEILGLLGIEEPEQVLTPKQIEALLVYAEPVKSPLVFLLHDVGIPSVKK